MQRPGAEVPLVENCPSIPADMVKAIIYREALGNIEANRR